MNIRIAAAATGVLLLATSCKKKPVNYDQYYTAEYNEEGYYARTRFFVNDVIAYPEVLMNGEQGSAPFGEWSGAGYPDMKFSTQLDDRSAVNRVSYADAPVYDVYIPDTFSLSKGAWFVFKQEVPVAVETKQLIIGSYVHDSMALYTSVSVPNDTVWIDLSKKNFYNLLLDSSEFKFVVSKQLPLQQPDGFGKGHIELRKVFKKWVQLVP